METFLAFRVDPPAVGWLPWIGAVVLFAIICIASIGDGYTDKRASAKTYPKWHRQFKRRRPRLLWYKLQNRYHVVKQIRFILPLLALLAWQFLLVNSFLLAGATIAGAAVGWAYAKRPPHWSRK